MATLLPGWTQLHQLPTPLTPGEAHLAAYLERELGPQWEVFVQPFLNGTRPDVVALHPTRGALILEVKDWDLSCYSWPQHGGRWRVRGSHGEASIGNPFAKVEHYRENVLRFLVPEIGALVRERGWGALGIVRVGVYFHGASEAQVRALTAGRVHGAVWQLGHDSLRPGAAERWVGGEGRVPAPFAPLLRAWLSPPQHALEQAAPLRLSRAQERLAQPQAGFTRFRGVAGSGKSLVLAARAARIAQAGGRVLIVSFNITLWHLLRDGVRRAGGGAALRNVVFNHFHGLARDLGNEAGLSWQDCGGDAAVLVRRAAAQLGTQYDAVLVDEAQDLEDDWAAVLMGLVREGGQFVAALDELQNVYGRPGRWLNDARFGRWRELRSSVRLHDRAVQLANDFAAAYLPGLGLLAESSQPMLPLGAPEFRWQDGESREAALSQATERVRELIRGGAQPTDIAVLLPDHRMGLAFVEALEPLGISVNHVFTDDQDDKRQKYAFWMGDARLKACTVHSFKGWEARHVVAVLDTPGHLSREQAMLAYTAITRAQGSLTVLNLSEGLRGFEHTARAELEQVV
ncbi:UvrD-like helicase C-terminal domain-containing protein [Deinococcus reticulitermitis]|uniref:UvrD-like helicase C-terminal domain-containing protein n=1 Tax=Deinococcus reticulitermitis TaxID=856736 RepID=A0A1H7CT66_9DEIO|nr:NERD domain-containing protein [Deinococcus reticulitermitis]SEJ92858.1 UvrD-like helicase C-terminal domain-containing protein [Deinococcus reticulitermitis]